MFFMSSVVSIERIKRNLYAIKNGQFPIDCRLWLVGHMLAIRLHLLNTPVLSRQQVMVHIQEGFAAVLGKPVGGPYEHNHDVKFHLGVCRDELSCHTADDLHRILPDFVKAACS